MSSPRSTRPFADAVVAYAQAGWPCIFPVPIDKAPPPPGFTGADGIDTDPVQLVRWATSHPDSSIAIRMPDGVIGIDVDEYAKGQVTKHGATTLAQLLERFGPLPATWTSTARGAGQPSRIHFYRVPAQRYVTRFPDVEIVQRHHRYAVVWPSPHKDAADIYRWYDPAGQAVDQPPKPGELPELPPAWVEGLREGATEAGPVAADIGSGQYLLEQLRIDSRDACPELLNALALAHAEVLKADVGGRHDVMTGRVHHIVQLAAAGHPGVGALLDNLAGVWAGITVGEERGEEFERMLLTSARKAVTAVGPRQVGADPCMAMGGLEIGVPLAPTVPAAGGPAPHDDRPGHEDPDPIEAPRDLHPAEVLGPTLFAPRANLDQRLADAVLERMWPVLRYGYDEGAWLLRERVVWATRSDLAEWAIAQVAETMPRGNPDAEKGSEERDHAERRKRLMSAGPAGAIAKKMRARVAGGAHPCALRIGDLDSEPWLLWAGGVGWDLTASLSEPVQAQIDPATPHMRSAGVAPAARPTPLWDTFTAAVWPDPELRTWALRVLSIAVTGYADKALPILIGERDRGKTQVVALLMSVLGSYAHAADPRLLNGLDNAHASIIYALKGRRLSFIDEGPREGRLGQERLKQLTGGGDLTGNQMNRNPITFTPTHTLVLTANDEPILTDPAIRGRTRLIPCEGDPVAVRAARAAIGHTTSKAWRREAPGVLAAMMREAAAWLANQDSALTSAAPEAYRNRAEEIAREQDPVRHWLEEETEPSDTGDRSRTLYEAFIGWCRNGNVHSNRMVSETRWGRELNDAGYSAEKRRDGNYRRLRIRPRAFLPGGPIGGGLGPSGGGSVEGSPQTLHTPSNPPQPFISGVQPSTEMISVEGVEGSHPTSVHAPGRTPAHDARTCAAVRENPPPSTVDLSAQNLAQNQGAAGGWRVSGSEQGDPPQPEPESAKITKRLLEARDAAKPVEGPAPKRTRAPKQSAEERATAKAAGRAAKLAAAIADAGGPVLTLPALVTRDGAITTLELDQVGKVLDTFGGRDELTVDVETTGYPVGHADYALRTVQLGGEHAAVVLDATDAAQLALAGEHLAAAAVLHAHSATADLVPLAVAGALDLEDGFARMHDTVIPAKLADPASTGSDPGLKQLAGTVLRDQATSPAADEARAALFKAGRWLIDTKATTPVERSGWANVDPRCATMIRYAASDVLDDAALAHRLPPVPPALLERERTAAHLTARVAHRGLAIDAEHVRELLGRERAALADAAQRLTGHGVDNPGSDVQVGAAAVQLGARLPATPTGRTSVAAGALEPYRRAEGQLGEFVRARLDYQRAETAIGLILEPYHQLVVRGDGRARPTVYTLAADTGRMSCLSSDALIEMPRDLAKYPGGVPIIEVQAGDWVYAFDHERELVLKRVKWCAQTGVRQTLIITAQNSAGHRITLRATPEHLIRLRNGDYRAAGKLLTTSGARRDGVRLMPMVRRQIDQGYVKFFPHSIARQGAGVTGGGRNREHRWVLERVLGRKISSKADVNHIDGNRANNHPANLQDLLISEHRGNRDLAWGIDQPALDLYAGPTDYRVISVEPGFIEPVWDMEVEDVHNFIANGICVHNCVRPNLQQVPREGGYRACITADPGTKIVSADFAGVELRVAAALSGDSNLRRLIAEEDTGQGDGVHWAIARLAFGPDATKAERYATKRGVFGRIYGGGVSAIAAGVGVSETVAAAIVDALDAMLPELTAWSAAVRDAVKRGHTQFPTYSGRIVHLPRAYPHKAPNYCIQGTARELLVDTLVRLRDTRWGSATLLPVHDEVLLVVPEADAATATSDLVAAMETDLHGIPIKAEASQPAFAWQDAS